MMVSDSDCWFHVPIADVQDAGDEEVSLWLIEADDRTTTSSTMTTMMLIWTKQEGI